MKTTIHIKPPLRTYLKKQKLFLRSQSTMLALAVFLLLLTETTAHKPPDTSGHGRDCIAREREALLSIKAGIRVDDVSPSLFSSWHGQDCCRWMGVRCSNRTGHVIKLDLHEGFLIGEISSSLKDLEHLRHLDLGGNYLTGPRGRLPDFLGSLHDLRYLDLSGLNFYGPVPRQLGNLSMLIYLDLASGYADQLYSRDISWLRQLSSLKHLDMTSVNLSTVTDWVDTVNMLSFLEVLMLSGCRLPPNNSTAHSAPHTNLTRLKTLDLSSNSIETFHNVAFVWGATSLKHLSLEHNMINDVLPAELGNLSALEILQLSENMMLKGMLPDTLMNLCNLKIIELSMNQLEGDMTEFIKRLPKCSWSKLQVLLLDGNNITGSLPDLVSRMTSLINLNLASNRLTGTLPIGIGNLSNLTYLDLHNNHMSGLITEEHFSKLSHLQELHLSANSFTMEWNSDWLPPFSLQILGLKSCCVGPGFPQWLKWQENISELYMSNASIADTMPDWFWVVFSKATILDLSSNNISGSLPATLGQMEAYLLDLSSNQFTGSVQQIPPNITVLDLSRNSLSGPLPLDVGSPMLVKVLGLSDNYFTGMIPTSICEMKSLTVFDIGNNMITGQLPQCSEYMASGSKMVSPDTASPTTDSSSNTSMPMSIQTLRLSNNNLSGEFPLLLQNCLQLNFIDLGQNKFFGSVPAWVGEKLAQLRILRLRSNMFSGSIPSQLRGLVYLQYLDLADNNFSGNIPKSLLNMDGVSDITEISFIYFPFRSYGSSDELAGSLGPHPHVSISAVTKGQRHEYTGHVIYMVNLDLSCNHLTGGIPKRIGPTTGLVNMNLSRNHLTGKMPENIGSMHSLESLDLSDNRISGEIPSSLSDLTSLSYLNLSYNNLSGRIPSGHQLDTLNPTNPASMYTGNIGLCGPPLQKNCSGNGIVQSHFSVNKEGSEIMTLYYGLSVGFVVGLWVVFCSLLFKKTWRTSYFLLFDEQCDALYVLVVVNWARMTTKATPTR